MNFVDSYRAVSAHLVEVDYEIQSVGSCRNQKLLTNEVSFLHKFTPQTQLDLTRDGVFVWINDPCICLISRVESSYRTLLLWPPPREMTLICGLELFCWMIVLININNHNKV